MDALNAFTIEQLASALKTRIESSLHNGQVHVEFSLQSVLAIEEDLSKVLPTIRYIRNTFAPINKLYPELLAAITTFVDDPFGRTTECADTQFFCAMVCRHWRNSLLAFPGIWSSVDTTNPRHMNLYLARSKEAPLHVNYGRMTPSRVFKQCIISERHRLRSFSIPLGAASHDELPDSLSESAESLRTLDVRMVYKQFSIPAVTMQTIARFAPNITVLRLHEITTGLAFLKFPALVTLTFRVTRLGTCSPDAADLVKFLNHSPDLEELDLRLPESPRAGAPAGTVTLAHLKSVVFDGSSTQGNTVGVNVLPYLVLPGQSITIDVQVRPHAFSSDTPPLLSVIQLGSAVFPRQSITAATIHIKDDPPGFFGHIGVCGERDNWIGLNRARVLNIGKCPLLRLRDWLDPAYLAQLHGIQTLTLGLFKFASDEEQCVGVLRTFLQGLDQVRVLNIYRMEVSLVARVLEPSDKTEILPLLEELRLHLYDPPELTRSEAHDKVQPGPSKKARQQGPYDVWGSDQEKLKVKRWRHELQKALLPRLGPIEEEDMRACDEIFKQLEDYEMTIVHLAFSKIGKVLRHICNRDDIPRQEEFKFQERARTLVAQWSRFITAEGHDNAKCCGCLDSGDMDADLPIIHGILRARRHSIGGLKEVIVAKASGRVTSVTLPYS